MNPSPPQQLRREHIELADRLRRIRGEWCAHASAQSLLATAWIGNSFASRGVSCFHGFGSPVKCMIATAEALRTGGGLVQRVGMALYPYGRRM